MQLYQDEKAFLTYFLPLFAVKLINITAENIILQAVAVVCFFTFLLYFGRRSYPNRLYQLYMVLGLYSAMLVFTCGKQGVLFSVIAVILMRGIDFNRIVYKRCLQVGVIFLLLSCYLEKDTGNVVLRYMNGDWVEMFKRSNILFISFIAVMFLYLLHVREFLKWKIVLPLIGCSYLMSIYTGSRTGMVVVVLFFILAFVLQLDVVKNRYIAKKLCILSPLLCLAMVYIATVNYGSNDIITTFDMLTQGRIYQSSIFLNQYGISIFGQHIVENFGRDIAGDFACLDSAYMDMLICEGAIFAIFWIIVTMKVIRFMWERNRMVEVAMLVAYAVYGMTETFLINCFLNISMFFYAEYLYSLPLNYSTNYMNSDYHNTGGGILPLPIRSINNIGGVAA